MNFAELTPEERDVRITALLLGEISPAEAEELQRIIAADPELTRAYEARKQTLGLVRETVEGDKDIPADAPKHLSNERREKLLARFRAAPQSQEKRKRSLWFIPLTAAAGVIGLLAAASLLPSLAKSKARAQRITMLPFGSLKEYDGDSTVTTSVTEPEARQAAEKSLADIRDLNRNAYFDDSTFARQSGSPAAVNPVPAARGGEAPAFNKSVADPQSGKRELAAKISNNGMVVLPSAGDSLDSLKEDAVKLNMLSDSDRGEIAITDTEAKGIMEKQLGTTLHFQAGGAGAMPAAPAAVPEGMPALNVANGNAVMGGNFKAPNVTTWSFDSGIAANQQIRGFGSAFGHDRAKEVAAAKPEPKGNSLSSDGMEPGAVPANGTAQIAGQSSGSQAQGVQYFNRSDANGRVQPNVEFEMLGENKQKPMANSSQSHGDFDPLGHRAARQWSDNFARSDYSIAPANGPAAAPSPALGFQSMNDGLVTGLITNGLLNANQPEVFAGATFSVSQFGANVAPGKDALRNIAIESLADPAAIVANPITNNFATFGNSQGVDLYAAMNDPRFGERGEQGVRRAPTAGGGFGAADGRGGTHPGYVALPTTPTTDGAVALAELSLEQKLQRGSGDGTKSAKLADAPTPASEPTKPTSNVGAGIPLPTEAPAVREMDLGKKLAAQESREEVLAKNETAQPQRFYKLQSGLNGGAVPAQQGTQAENRTLALQLKKEEARKKTSISDRAEPEAPKRPATPPPTPQPEVLTRDNAFSTFSLNVADVSFKLAAASLEKGAMPEAANIRAEEFLNAFDYRDPVPPPGVAVGFTWERAQFPFAQNRDALRFSVKTAAAGRDGGRPLNIVLLLDSSGSMERADRVRIIQEGLRTLATQLQAQDKISVVTFARTARLWVDGVSGTNAMEVARRVSEITPEGGTNLGEALDVAYATAQRHYAANAINRVVLLTDGAANLGDVEPANLKAKVETNRKQGIALDCFGVGWEGFNDDLLEQLSRNGDGRYGFLNSPEAAATEFAAQLAGALRVAASDVKVQVEFNPKRVTAYRQIGYAKHQLTKEQFRDNKVDAAEIGASEAGNGLYVIETNPRGEGPIATVRVRYRVPNTSDYREQEWVVPFTPTTAIEQASPQMKLAVTSAEFAESLASSPYAAEVTTDRLLQLFAGVPDTFGADPRPKKLEWMIRQAKSISGK